jgi:hypothetical protein
MHDTLKRPATHYFVLTAMGWGAMILAQYVVAYLLGMAAPAVSSFAWYAFAYPAVFACFAYIVARRPLGIPVVNAVALCVLPSVYWFVHYSMEHQPAAEAISIFDSSGMMIVMPFTFAIVATILIIVSPKYVEDQP